MKHRKEGSFKNLRILGCEYSLLRTKCKREVNKVELIQMDFLLYEKITGKSIVTEIYILISKVKSQLLYFIMKLFADTQFSNLFNIK